MCEKTYVFADTQQEHERERLLAVQEVLTRLRTFKRDWALVLAGHVLKLDQGWIDHEMDVRSRQ